MQRYRVIDGNGTLAVGENNGGIIFELLESRQEARSIRDILDEGIGPEWEQVEFEQRSKEKNQ